MSPYLTWTYEEDTFVLWKEEPPEFIEVAGDDYPILSKYFGEPLDPEHVYYVDSDCLCLYVCVTPVLGLTLVQLISTTTND